jgi:hypothetical protein
MILKYITIPDNKSYFRGEGGTTQGDIINYFTSFLFLYHSAFHDHEPIEPIEPIVF